MKKMSKEDIGLLALALFIALALWANVTISRQDTIAEKQILGIHLQVTGLPARYQSDINPTTADIILQGTPSELSKINPEDIRLIVDLSGISEGKWLITPKINLTDPQRVWLVKTIPDKIEVTVKPIPPEKLNDTEPDEPVESE